MSMEVKRDMAVEGSPELLIRAIGNVVDNALKFTPSSGRVEVSVEEDGTDAVVHVRDTGVGMDGDTAAHAFDRFWRADEARTQPGYGLGLSLVQQICHAHGGTVAIGGRPGVGTTVRLTFPAVRRASGGRPSEPSPAPPRATSGSARDVPHGR